jgi:uncharacterized protein (DUF433 family)
MIQVTNGHEALDGWRTESMYSYSEAAHLANVSTSTVKNWLFGYTVKGRDVPPLFPSSDAAMVSFLQMIEIMVAGRFRKSALGGKSVPFRAVRDAYVNARESWGIEYPFAHMRLEALGGQIVHFLKEGGSSASYQALDSPRQWTLPGLLRRETIDKIEYDHDLAARWFPIGKTVPIVVDPRLSTGLPVIEGRGVTVQAIRNRFKAGLRIDFIARDFEMEPDLVETALQYGERIAA